MAEVFTISKKKSQFPPYLDFEKLRKAGITHIQKLSGKIWTDHNLHDPGITMLELLCYAITDLGYRTNLKIEDIVAPVPKDEESGVILKPKEDNFFTPAQILTNNPLTILDYRKLLMEIKGVRNAWLQKASEADRDIYFNMKKGKLQLKDDTEDTHLINLNGLYNVYLDIDENDIEECGGVSYIPMHRILKEARELLHQHRNLGEDFLRISTINKEKISLCTDVELASEADKNKVLLEIYKSIQNFLAPPINYYSLQELLEKGRSIEEIFEGRPLLKKLSKEQKECRAALSELPLEIDSYGFIDTEELYNLQPRHVIYASDIYRIISKIAGVRAIKKLYLLKSIGNKKPTGGEPWCLRLSDQFNYRPVLSPENSTITFFKGDLVSYGDKSEVIEEYLEQLEVQRKSKKSQLILDKPIPYGRLRNITDYTSIQDELPVVYGTGHDGLPEYATEKRRRQAKQLQAYLTFIDQILINYLAQLANVRKLFSFTSGKNTNDRTYFKARLQEMPWLKDIIQNYLEPEENFQQNGSPILYGDYLDFILEDTPTYTDRKDRFLNHLMARFAENFTDYVLLAYNIEGSQISKKKIIEHKSDFLAHYPEITRDRARAHNYHNCDLVWCDNNISGLKKRVSRLFALKNGEQWELANYRVGLLQGGSYSFDFKDSNGKQLLVGSETYNNLGALRKAYKKFIQVAKYPGSFRDFKCNETLCYKDFTYRFNLAFGDLSLAYHQSEYYSEEERNREMHRISTLVKNEGLNYNLIKEEKGYSVYFGLPGPNIKKDTKNSSVEKRPEVFDKKKWILKTSADPDQQQSWLNFYKLLNYAIEGTLKFISIDEGNEFSFNVAYKGKELAFSKPFSESSGRDKVLNEIRKFLQQRSIKVIARKGQASYSFQLSDERQRVILRDIHKFATSRQICTFFPRILELASDVSNFRKTQQENKWAVELISGKVPESGDMTNVMALAKHPQIYATEKEANDVIDGIVKSIQEFFVSGNIVKENNEFLFQIRDEHQSQIVKSVRNYADFKSAFKYYHITLKNACDQKNFKPVPKGNKYIFVIEGPKDVLAESTGEFQTIESCQAAIDKTSEFIKNNSELEYLIVNEGKFNLHILERTKDQEYCNWLVSEESFLSAKAAYSIANNILELGQDQNNYDVILHYPGGCRFSFMLKDKQAVIAHHPHHEYTKKQAITKCRELRDTLLEQEVPHKLDRSPGRYFYSFFDEYCNLLFEIKNYTNGKWDAFGSKEEAGKAYKVFLNIARFEDKYHRENHRWFIKNDPFQNENKRYIARSIETKDELKLSDIKKLTIRILNIQNLYRPCCWKLTDSKNKWQFHLPFPDLPDDTSDHINDCLNKKLAELIFKPVKTNGHWSILLVLHCIQSADRVTTSDFEDFYFIYPLEYKRKKDAETDIKKVENQLNLKNKKVEARISLTMHPRFCLRGATGEPLLMDIIKDRSGNVHQKHNFLEYILSAQIKKRFETIPENKDGTDRYTFILKNGKDEIIARPVSKFFPEEIRYWENEDDVERFIEDEVQDFTRKFHIQYNDHIYYQLQGTGCHKNEVLLQSTRKYDHTDEGEKMAWKDLNREFLIYAQNRNNYILKRNLRSDCGYSFIVTKPGYRLACHPCFTSKRHNLMQDLEELIGYSFSSCQVKTKKKDKKWQFVIVIIGNETQCQLVSTKTFTMDEEAYSRGELQKYYIIHLGRTKTNFRKSRIGWLLLDKNNKPVATTETDNIDEVICLTRAFPFTKTSANEFSLRLYSTRNTLREEIKEKPRVILESISSYSSVNDELETLLDLLKKIHNNWENYDLIDKMDEIGRVDGKECRCLLSFCIVDKSKIIAESDIIVETRQEREEVLEQLIQAANMEGFHFVEHILLRPQKGSDDKSLLEIKPNQEDLEAIRCLKELNKSLTVKDLERNYVQGMDPYSFWGTVILPYWPTRFRDPNFRDFFEKTIRMEVPAHMALRICWMDAFRLKEFERVYKAWLKSACKPSDCSNELNKLIAIMNRLTNTYESNRELSGCDAEVTNPIVLDRTNIE